MILRFAYPGRMAIEHFDEGVYASNFWFGAEEGYEYPARYLYAPPLLPAVIEWTMIFASMCGVHPTGFIPMIPSLIAGLATIPSIWWVGRRWFGPSAGVVSAWLVAASDFHASYSRAALTDVPVCLFILWGTYFTWQALQTGTRRSIGLASLFTALAWWTKYNGWLPLAIGISGGIAWQITLPWSNRQLVAVAQRWGLVAGLSFLLWLPVLVGLQKHGGYAAVAANHGQYVEGLPRWLGNADTQLGNISLYDGLLRPALQSFFGYRLRAYVSIPEFVAGLPHLLLLLVIIVGCLCCCFRQKALPTAGAQWALLAWICGMTVATPFYHAYPRLVMPWMMACWLGTGLMVQLVIDSDAIFALRRLAANQNWKAQWLEISLAIWLIAGLATRCYLGQSYAWEDRSEVARSVLSLLNQIKTETTAKGYPADEAIVYVYGHPAAVFALKADGLPLVAPVANLSFVQSPHPRPTFFLFPAHFEDRPVFKSDWEANRSSFGKVSTKDFGNSHLVRLDNDGQVGFFRNGLCLVDVRN